MHYVRACLSKVPSPTVNFKPYICCRDVHKEYRKKGYSFDQLQSALMICRLCHSAIHRTFDNKQLAGQYNTLDKLMANDSMQRFVGWARKQRVAGRREVQAAHYRYRR